MCFQVICACCDCQLCEVSEDVSLHHTLPHYSSSLQNVASSVVVFNYIEKIVKSVKVLSCYRKRNQNFAWLVYSSCSMDLPTMPLSLNLSMSPITILTRFLTVFVIYQVNSSQWLFLLSWWQTGVGQRYKVPVIPSMVLKIIWRTMR